MGSGPRQGRDAFELSKRRQAWCFKEQLVTMFDAKN